MLQASTPIASLAGGEISGDVDSNTSRVLTLPASTVLAYQVLELAVDSQGPLPAIIGRTTLYAMTSRLCCILLYYTMLYSTTLCHFTTAVAFSLSNSHGVML